MTDDLERPFCEVYREMQEEGLCGKADAYHPSGVTIVGEVGPEIVKLPASGYFMRARTKNGGYHDGGIVKLIDRPGSMRVYGESAREFVVPKRYVDHTLKAIEIPELASTASIAKILSDIAAPSQRLGIPSPSSPAKVECSHCRQMVAAEKKPCTAVAFCNEITRPKW